MSFRDPADPRGHRIDPRARRPKRATGPGPDPPTVHTGPVPSRLLPLPQPFPHPHVRHRHRLRLRRPGQVRRLFEEERIAGPHPLQLDQGRALVRLHLLRRRSGDPPGQALRPRLRPQGRIRQVPQLQLLRPRRRHARRGQDRPDPHDDEPGLHLQPGLHAASRRRGGLRRPLAPLHRPEGGPLVDELAGLAAAGRLFAPYLTFALKYDTSDSQIHPTRGFRFILQEDLSGSFMGSRDAAFSRLTVDFRKYLRVFGEKDVFAVRALAQYVGGDADPRLRPRLARRRQRHDRPARLPPQPLPRPGQVPGQRRVPLPALLEARRQRLHGRRHGLAFAPDGRPRRDGRRRRPGPALLHARLRRPRRRRLERARAWACTSTSATSSERQSGGAVLSSILSRARRSRPSPVSRTSYSPAGANVR
ncbi:MAG: outer membrane protein assembly factor [Candidatus Moduliflexus flocculans]|nr:outer membrane protein assembly factor [Candidatus Moduliflexus flocculans]